MRPEFWLQAWESGKRGFHMDEPHCDLCEHGPSVFETGSVLVPLCGATHDLGWLADNGFQAVGVELSPIAVGELVERYGLQAQGTRGRFEVFGNERITVLQGDFFQLEADHVGPVTGIWDRAALVAMHPDQRRDYVAVQQGLLGPGALLLNVMDYDRTRMDGPPWATGDAVVRELWPGIELVDERSMQGQGRFEVVGTVHTRLYHRGSQGSQP